MLYGSTGLLYNETMKKRAFLIFILIAVLIVSGCQRSLYLRLSDRKVAGIDVSGEKSETEDTTDASEDETVEPSGEVTESETPESESSSEPASDTAESTTGPEEPGDSTAPETTETETEAPTTTRTPATTKAPETTVPATTKTPETTNVPATTKAPTTTKAPETTEPPTTTEDTFHTEANVDRIEIKKLPDKTFYDQYAELISTVGMTLLASWADGYEKLLTTGWTVCDAKGSVNPRTESEGDQTIYVMYGGKSASFTITYRLAEDAPLRLTDAYSAGRVFYEGEYLKHLFSAAWVGNQQIAVSNLTFSQERLTGTGTLTIRISYGQHAAERTMTVVPASQYVLTQEDLYWLRYTHIQRIPDGGVLTASWMYEYAWTECPEYRPANHPVISDIIPESEFTFDPPTVQYGKPGEVTVYCRGLSQWFSVF